MLKRFAALALPLVICALVSPAAQAQSNPGQIMKNYDATTVVAMLNEINVATRVSQMSDGTHLIFVDVAPGQAIILAPLVCVGEGNTQCQALSIAAAAPPDALPYASTSENLMLMNALNEMLQFAKVMMVSSQQGAPLITMNLIGENGYSKGSFYASLVVFGQSADVFFQTLAEAKAGGMSSGFETPAHEGTGDSDGLASLKLATPSANNGFAALNGSRADTKSLLSVPSILDNPSFVGLMRSKHFFDDYGYNVEIDEKPANQG